MYELHVKSEIKNITPIVLNTILRIEGYDVSDDNTIKFKNLKDAQKVELELRLRFSCFVIEHSNVTFRKERIIKLELFKENGKWYDELIMRLHYYIQAWDIIDAIQDAIQKSEDYYSYFIYYGYYPNNVPFLVLPKKDSKR